MGLRKIDIWGIGGGGGGAGGYTTSTDRYCGNGGWSGHTALVSKQSITNKNYSITIGAGGGGGTTHGTSNSVTIGSKSMFDNLLTAYGSCYYVASTKTYTETSVQNATTGSSNPSSYTLYSWCGNSPGGTGYSGGGNEYGGAENGASVGGTDGQGSSYTRRSWNPGGSSSETWYVYGSKLTTRAFGESTNTLYGGGGGGGACSTPGQAGGSGGGGAGGTGSSYLGYNGSAGTANTGSGGGGAGGASSSTTTQNGGAGGSGVIIVRWAAGGN